MTPPCPSCGARLTLYRTYAKCYACGWTAEPNPYRRSRYSPEERGNA